MKDTLAILMRLRQQDIDTLQQDLAAVRASRAALETEEEAQNAMIVREQSVAQGSYPAGRTYGAFARLNADEKAERALRRRELELRESALREALQAAYFEQKKIEHLSRKRMESARKAALLREGKHLDEQAIMRFVRR